MSASCCLIYFGLRFEVKEEEIEPLELEIDPRMLAARKAKLNDYWCNFGGLDEWYLLFVGAEIGIIGPEDKLEAYLSDDGFNQMVESTRTKLKQAGFNGSPKLYIQWMQDV